MDLSNVKPNTQKVAIRHPGSGELTGLVIEVGSSESPAVKKVERQHLDKAIRNRNKKPTSAEIEAQMIERLAATMVGWEWAEKASWGGKKLEFNKENVASVLEAGWVRSQVKEVADDEAGFFSN